MTTTTRANQAAEDHARSVWSDDECATSPINKLHRTRSRVDFLAGRQHFIEHELRGLLELAQEAGYSEDYGQVCFEYAISELIDKARKS